MSTATFHFFDKDTGAVLTFALTDENGDPFDTTDYSLEALVEEVGVFDLESVSASGGTARYVTTAADFPAGVHRAQVRAYTAGNTAVRYWYIDNIIVAKALEEA